MSTFPLSKLPADVQAKHAEYANTPFITWVKPVLTNLFRFMISGSSDKEMDKMLADGWLVIDASK